MCGRIDIWGKNLHMKQVLKTLHYLFLRLQANAHSSGASTISKMGPDGSTSQNMCYYPPFVNNRDFHLHCGGIWPRQIAKFRAHIEICRKDAMQLQFRVSYQFHHEEHRITNQTA